MSKCRECGRKENREVLETSGGLCAVCITSEAGRERHDRVLE